MGETLAEKRWAENEVMFRQTNQKVPDSLDAVKKLAEEDDHQDILASVDDMAINFYCECSDEKCTKRIILKPDEYRDLHRNRKQFIVIPGHEMPTVERVIAEGPGYFVVEKYENPPKEAHKLNTTGLNNT
jgi:hypothetical protein